MAPRITPITWDQYHERDTVQKSHSQYDKPLETEEDRFAALFDINRSHRDNKEHLGYDHQENSKEKIAVIKIKKNHPLYPPHLEPHYDEETATKSTYAHFRAILEEGGPRGLKLVRELATAGNTATQDSHRMGLDGSFSIVANSQGVSKILATLVETALEVYPPSYKDASHHNKEFRTTDTESISRTLAKAKAASLKSREGQQELPTNAQQIPFKRFIAALDARAKPTQHGRLHPNTVAEMLQPTHFVQEKDPNKPTYGTFIDVGTKLRQAVPETYHDLLLERMNSRNKALRAASLPIPPESIQGNTFKVETISTARALITDPGSIQTMQKHLVSVAKAAAQSGQQEEILVVSMKKDIEPEVKNKPNLLLTTIAEENKKRVHYLSKNGYSREAAQFLDAAEQMVEFADVVDGALDKTPNKLNLFVLGLAAKKGKLGQVTQDGKPLTQAEARALVLPAHKSNSELTRASLAKGLDVHLSEPSAALALEMIFSTKPKNTSSKDIQTLQTLDTSLLNLITTVNNPQQAQKISEQSNISLDTLSLLRNSQAVADAGRNLLHVQNELMQRRQSIIGREHFPEGLAGSTNMPNYLIISGDPEVFASLKGLVGIVGEPLGKKDKDMALASTIAPHLAAIAQTGAPRVWVDGATPVPIKPKRNDVVIVPGGQPLNDEAQAQRDAVGAITIFTHIPSWIAYEPPTTEKKGKRGKEILIQNTQHPSYHHKAGRLLGALADRLVVTNGRDTGAYNVVQEALITQLKDGKKVAVVDPKRMDRDATPITYALATQTGRAALHSAGFGAAVSENPELAKLDGGPIAMRLSNARPQQAADALAALAKGKRPITETSTQQIQDHVL
jgi:hypothetical protein